jgi:hypothetical protein
MKFYELLNLILEIHTLMNFKLHFKIYIVCRIFEGGLSWNPQILSFRRECLWFWNNDSSSTLWKWLVMNTTYVNFGPLAFTHKQKMKDRSEKWKPDESQKQKVKNENKKRKPSKRRKRKTKNQSKKQKIRKNQKLKPRMKT